MKPIVDVTIAVHTATRPIARAVSSILDHTSTSTRVTVIAHNIDKQVIARNLGVWLTDERVRLLELQDGVSSPAGPMNLGLEESTAPFLSILGSDDEFEPGAIDSWYRLQQETAAEVVIAMVRHEAGGKELSPPTRPGRRSGLHAVKDRLSYRSAPLGLISSERFGDVRFAAGLKSGEDLPYVTSLWFSGGRISFARTGPGYLVHSGADDRVTSGPRSIYEDFAFLDHIFDEKRSERLSSRERNALAIKVLRVHLFDAVVNRSVLDEWPTGERKALSSVAERILAWGKQPERALSLIDRSVLDGIVDGITPVADLMALIRRRWNYRSIDVLLTRNPLYAFHRQGPLRTYIGGYFI